MNKPSVIRGSEHDSALIGHLKPDIICLAYARGAFWSCIKAIIRMWCVCAAVYHPLVFSGLISTTLLQPQL